MRTPLGREPDTTWGQKTERARCDDVPHSLEPRADCEPLAAVASRMRAELSAGGERLRESVAGLDGAVTAVAAARQGLREHVGACRRGEHSY